LVAVILVKNLFSHKVVEGLGDSRGEGNMEIVEAFLVLCSKVSL